MTPAEQANLIAYSIVSLEEERERFSQYTPVLKEISVSSQIGAFHAVGREIYELVTHGTAEDLSAIATAYTAERARRGR